MLLCCEGKRRGNQIKRRGRSGAGEPKRLSPNQTATQRRDGRTSYISDGPRAPFKREKREAIASALLAFI